MNPQLSREEKELLTQVVKVGSLYILGPFGGDGLFVRIPKVPGVSEQKDYTDNRAVYVEAARSLCRRGYLELRSVRTRTELYELTVAGRKAVHR